jgi:hypothetical protein
MTSDPNAPSDSKWLDINAFASAPLGTWGNCGIGITDAPGYTNTDLTLAKRFSMGGNRYLEVRAETFNTFNHPNWAPPGVSLANLNTFGVITGTVNAPRVVQFALKFYF